MITMFVYDLTPEHLAQNINWGFCDPEEVDWVRYLSACYNRDKYNFFELWDVSIIHGFLNMINNFYCEELGYSYRSKTEETILKHQLKWLERDYLPYRHPEANGDEKRELAQWYNIKFQNELTKFRLEQNLKSIKDVETSPQPGTQKQVLPTCFDTPQGRQIFQNADNADLPSVYNTDREKKYYARAIELGYMKRTAIGYKWLFGGNRGLARLGYFVVKVYCPNNTEQLPESAINTLFGVNRIASAITQLYNAKKPQKWRADIDKIFTD